MSMTTYAKIRKGYLSICVLLILCGCQDSKQLEELQHRIILVEHRLQATQDKLWSIPNYDNIFIDVSEKGFDRIDANLGTFFIVLDDVQPYADGYKISLRIGNPHFIKYSGIKMKVEWGKRRPPSPNPADFPKEGEFLPKYTEWMQSEDEWKKQSKTKELSFVETLEAGAWTKIEITLSPATKEEIGHLRLSNMKVEKISLIKKE